MCPPPLFHYNGKKIIKKKMNIETEEIALISLSFLSQNKSIKVVGFLWEGMPLEGLLAQAFIGWGNIFMDSLTCDLLQTRFLCSSLVYIFPIS